MARKVLIVGSGGHARVVASILALDEQLEIVGTADRTAATLGQKVGLTSVVTTFDELPAWRDKGVASVVLAIGDNAERAAMFERLRQSDFSIHSAVHPTAIIERDAEIGIGTVICAGAIICTQVRLGDNVLVNTGAIVDHECYIGAHTHIAPGVRLAGRVRVGDGTFIGIGSAVKEKIAIGAWSVVGAGSVVVEDIPDRVTVFGVPARVPSKKAI